MIDDAGKPLRLWYVFAAVLGAFALGIIPLLVAVPPTPTGDTGTAFGTQTNVEASSLDISRGGAAPLQLSPAESRWPSAESSDCPTTDLRVLVIASDGEEKTLPAIRQALNYLGVPYAVYVASTGSSRVSIPRGF